ncbi:bifunctional DNA primase/polymerase, partial [Streptomyces spongiae]
MTHDPRSALLSAALQAAARGWSVIPLRPGGKMPALHGEDACPHTGECAEGHRKPEQRATTDPGRIHAAWGAHPFNVGIATGPSGLVVVDLDAPKTKGSSDAPSGATNFEALCERAGVPWPATYTVRTRGGQHLYFTAPDDTRLSNSAGSLAPLVDTRAWGGHVVAPGSTVDGATYEVTHPAPVAPLPDWLLHHLTT